jgi:hypothetical protein
MGLGAGGGGLSAPCSLLPAFFLPFSFISVILFNTNFGNHCDIAVIKNWTKLDRIGQNRTCGSFLTNGRAKFKGLKV